MLKLGIIEVSNSPYINPIVIVTKKKYGSIKLCLDARRLNERILLEYDSPLSMDDILNQYNSTKCIFNLRSSFWQITLDQKSKPFITFQFLELTCHFKGLYH